MYSQYLPVSLQAYEAPTIVSRTRSRVQTALLDFIGHHVRWVQRRNSVSGADFDTGDEELEEGMGIGIEHLPRNAGDHSGDRRLSRDLEAGFRDDSDDDEEEQEDIRGRGRIRR